MKPKLLKRSILVLLLVFIAMNTIAYFHASKFTHFASGGSEKTKPADKLSTVQKLKALLFGINNPRPQNLAKPSQPFETMVLNDNKKTEGWLIKTKQSKGTVVLCHGYSGHKSSMLNKAGVFLSLGYNAFLIDFMGSGGSGGNQTTIGFYEAQQVTAAVNYLNEKGEKNIILMGTSMGAVAIMKALKDGTAPVTAVILECPFGTMMQTVEARFANMHVPAFPMAQLLMYWGGRQNNFNAFDHNPADYAKAIRCPALLLYGEKDQDVSRSETEAIFASLKGKKQLRTYSLAGHEDYLVKYKRQWTADVSAFMASLEK